MANDVSMTDNTKEFLEDLKAKQTKALIQCGMQCEAHAKLELESEPRRIDTGRLRNSITWATKSEHSDPRNSSGDEYGEVEEGSGCPETPTDDKSVFIGTNVEYAADVHEGDPTKKMSPNRFLRNAVENYSDEYRKIIDETLKED